jgi:N-acetylglucosaminyldiphosphoundecaprenol N-acetyl-beta-D-mannosaminyltransferase
MHRPGEPSKHAKVVQLHDQRIWIDRMSLHSVTLEETLERAAQAIANRQFCQIVTANLDFMWLAYRDPAFLELINSAGLVVADGVPLIWLTKLAGCPLPGRVNGTDLVHSLARLSAERGYRLFFFGGAPGVAEQAAVRLQTEFPDMVNAGCYSPPFGAWDELETRRIVNAIRKAKPDVLFVGLGAPRQDQWIAAMADILDVPVCVGIGGSLDFFAGRLDRAPVWMQRHGLEWLHRLTTEPGRLWRRYLLHDGPLFARLVGWALVTRRKRNG